MAETWIDISRHRSKSVQEFREKHFNYVDMVCDDAKEAYLFFPGENFLHKGFQELSKFKGADDEILKKARHARNEIKDWLHKTFRIQK